MKIIVYANTETKASRGYRPRPGETVAYRDANKFDKKEPGFDKVIVLGEFPHIEEAYAKKEKDIKSKK